LFLLFFMIITPFYNKKAEKPCRSNIIFRIYEHFYVINKFAFKLYFPGFYPNLTF